MQFRAVMGSVGCVTGRGVSFARVGSTNSYSGELQLGTNAQKISKSCDDRSNDSNDDGDDGDVLMSCRRQLDPTTCRAGQDLPVEGRMTRIQRKARYCSLLFLLFSLLLLFQWLCLHVRCEEAALDWGPV